jgi:hypothetical protein
MLNSRIAFAEFYGQLNESQDASVEFHKQCVEFQKQYAQLYNTFAEFYSQLSEWYYRMRRMHW